MNDQPSVIHKPKRGLFYYLGNILIVLSLFGLAFTYYPIVRLYFFPPETQAVVVKESKDYYLSIPKIQAEAPIILNVDPWNEKEYKEALEKGIAHTKNTKLPGEKGLIYLFAHSSALPWEITRYNTIFYRLSELEKNDEILITNGDKKYVYKVFDKKEVWPTEIEYLTKNKNDELILQTCTPVGTDLKRLLVFSRLVSSSSVEELHHD